MRTLFALLLFVQALGATAFTSSSACTTSCNWNDGASWTGGSGSNWPSSSGDTAAISAAHKVTIPSGVSITVGAITYSAGANFTTGLTTITVNGTLNLSANVTGSANSAFNLGPDAVLDLNGHAFNPGGATQYNWIGSAGHLWTVQSTGSAGTFGDGAFRIIPDLQYGTITQMAADAVYGRTHTTSGAFLSYQYVTWTGNTGAQWLDSTGASSNQGFLISHCQFLNPTNANPETASAYQPGFVNAQAIGSATRLIEYSTWNTSGTVNGIMLLHYPSITFRNNVVVNEIIKQQDTSTYSGNFFANAIGDGGAQSGAWFAGGFNAVRTWDGNYGYFPSGNHAFDYWGDGDRTITNNVFEVPPAFTGANIFLWNGATTGAIQITGNVFLWAGTPWQYPVGASVFTSQQASGNTFYINNGGGEPVTAMVENSEQGGSTSGTNQIYNNIISVPDTTLSLRDSAVYYILSTSDQMTFGDYNAGWGYPGGSLSPPVVYGCPPGYSGPKQCTFAVTGGYGTHDFSANPGFVARTRGLATWDASLGGAGTAANAISQLVAGASGYTTSALVNWVRQGWAPQNTVFANAGYSSGRVGAVAPVNVASAAALVP